MFYFSSIFARFSKNYLKNYLFVFLKTSKWGLKIGADLKGNNSVNSTSIGLKFIFRPDKFITMFDIKFVIRVKF